MHSEHDPDADERWLESRTRSNRMDLPSTYQGVPIDKFGPIKVAPPLSVKIIAGVLLLLAAYGVFSALREWPIFRGVRPLPVGTPAEFFRWLYLINLQFIVFNSLAAVLLLGLVRYARLAAILVLAGQFGYLITFLIMKATILHRTLIPLAKNPSLSSLVLFVIVCFAGMVLMVVFGSMAVALMDVDVVKVYEGRPRA